ncbi:hypothetical protein D9M72_573110 [compost metagenome]
MPDLRQGLLSYGFLRPLDGSFTSDDHAQKKYDAAFHEDAVRLVLSSDRSVKQVAEEIGVKKARWATSFTDIGNNNRAPLFHPWTQARLHGMSTKRPSLKTRG